MKLDQLGKVMIGAGVFALIAGAALVILGRFVDLSKIPGNIVLERSRSTYYLPIGLSILISVLLTVVLNLIMFIWRR